MICSIDDEQCAGGIRLADLLPSVGLTLLVLVVAAIAYEFREFIGRLLIPLLGAAVLWSLGLLQRPLTRRRLAYVNRTRCPLASKYKALSGAQVNPTMLPGLGSSPSRRSATTACSSASLQ